MTMFLIQSLLWLLVAFLLGYGLGRWLKGRVCQRKQTALPSQFEKETSHLRVPVTTAAVATGTAAAASLAAKREPTPAQTTAKPVELAAKPVELKTPVVTAPAPVVEVSSSLLNKVEVQAELEPPKVDTPSIEVSDIKTAAVGLGSAALAAAAVKLAAPDGEVNLSVTELVPPPETELDLKTLRMNVPASGTDLSAAEWHDAKASVDVVAVNVPQVDVNTPELPDLKLPPVDLGLAAANLQTPEGKADLTALRVDLPDVPVHLPTAGIELEHAKLGAGRVELNTPDGLYTVEGAQVEALDQTQGAVAIRLTKPDGDVQLAAFATDPSGKASLAAVDSQSLELQSFELGSLQSGLVNQDWLASLKAAAVSAGLGAVVAKAGSALADTPKPVDESDWIERSKTVAVELERANDLLNVEIGTTGQGLNADFLASLKTASAATETSSVGGSSSNQVTAAATATTNAAPDAPTHVTVQDVMLTTVADTLASQPKPVDESDLIESGKNVVEAVLNPTGLTASDITALQQTTNSDAQTLTGLTLAAASAGTVAAVQANLDSGAQPMIVDESDAIEAIKLAWDGELSPSELTALERSLILRPGETGRLGLVTCSVPSANCVALGGLEGDLHAGTAMHSKLFDVAVRQQDDGNYVFSTLAKWMPNWAASSGLSADLAKTPAAASDELPHLVWDQDPSALDYAAGYELILREGQYGDLGLVSCAVPAAGVVSLGGIEGQLAEGQTAVSKLYGIFVERVGEVYTFKQFSKPSGTSDSSGVRIPVTTSETIEMLEPDLEWNDDKIRVGVQHLIAESQHRRGSKLVSQLWDADSGYDCGLIEGEESLVLKPGLYGKLGSVHCGVTKPGRVVVSGDVSALAEGEGVLFHLYHIVVCRDDEDNYRFERLKDLV